MCADSVNPTPEQPEDDILDHQQPVEMDAFQTPETEAAEAAEVAEPPADVAPNSAAPPRIVSETPLGGVIQPDLAGIGREQSSELPIHPPDPKEATIPGDVESAMLHEQLQRALDQDVMDERAPDEDVIDEIDEIEEAVLAEDAHPDMPAEETPEQESEQAQGLVRFAPAQTERPLVQPATVVAEDTAEEWDDDISPALASVLFAQRETPAAPAARAGVPAVEPVVRDRPTPDQPAAEAAPPTGPIQLTDIEDVRRLPITAEGHSAPAPDATLDAQQRYVRIEEPLKNDQGQRVEESWSYFKSAYPGLAGRLVREVRTETITYADGSWVWTYERRYDDRGRDRRTVRANAGRTYIEREDEVSVIIQETGKRQRIQEEAALILAAPEREEKRGLLGGLLGRDKNENGASAKSWREATPAERRHARKTGGAAFERGLLARLL